MIYLYLKIPRRILGCAYTICSYSQILISCTIPSESPFPTSRVLSYTLSVLVWLHSLNMSLIVSSLSPHNLHLLFFFASYLFLLWYGFLMALFCSSISFHFCFMAISILLILVSSVLFLVVVISLPLQKTTFISGRASITT